MFRYSFKILPDRLKLIWLIQPYQFEPVRQDCGSLGQSISFIFRAQVGHFAATPQSDVVGIWSCDLGIMATLSLFFRAFITLRSQFHLHHHSQRALTEIVSKITPNLGLVRYWSCFFFYIALFPALEQAHCARSFNCCLWVKVGQFHPYMAMRALQGTVQCNEPIWSLRWKNMANRQSHPSSAAPLVWSWNLQAQSFDAQCVNTKWQVTLSPPVLLPHLLKKKCPCVLRTWYAVLLCSTLGY